MQGSNFGRGNVMEHEEKSFGRGKWWMSQLVQLAIVGMLFVVWFGDLNGVMISSEMVESTPSGMDYGTKLTLTFVLIGAAWAVHLYSAVRRYNDMGKSPLWVLTGFIPYVGPLIQAVHLGGTRTARKPGSKPRFGDSAQESVDLSKAGYLDLDGKIAAMKRRNEAPDLSNASPIVTRAPRQTSGGPVQRNPGFGRRGLS
jgi:uncharacterized membrane protein YhaH (DUF805 family)